MKKRGSLNIIALWAAVVALLCGSVPAFSDDNVYTDPEKFGDWVVTGPSGGDVRAVAVDPRDKNRLYISTLDGQIYTSADAGKMWTLLVNLNEPQLILDQLFVDSVDSKIIYASGHRFKEPGGFFKSSDGGATWKEAKELRKESIHSMTQSTFDPKMLAVGTLDGVWVSHDSGDNWEKIQSTTMPVNIDSMAIDPRRPSTMYAGTWWRAYKTTDSGKTWRLIKNGMIDDSDVFAINIDPRNADHVIASACSGIYESLNGGENWGKIQGIPSQSRRTRDILQHPSVAGTIYAATTEGFWMSTNGGKAWMLTTQRDLEINSIAVHPDEPNRVYIGTNNYGVMVSNDGGKNFVQTNDNFTSRFTYSITPDIEQANRLYAATHNTVAGGGFFFISNDSGRTWQQSKSIDPNKIRPFSLLQDRTDPNKMYLGTNVGLFTSADRGVTWALITAPKPKPVKKAVARKPAAKGAKTVTKVEPKTPPPPAPMVEQPGLVPALTGRIRSLTFSEDGKSTIFAATDSGLYRSGDVTKGWERISLGEGNSDSVFAVYTTSVQPGTIWVGTDRSGVLVSRDDAETWSRIDGIPTEVPISSIAIDPKRPYNVYVGTMQAFYLSRDGGRTWNRRGGNLPLGNFVSILINPQNTDEIFVASSLESDGGIYYSENAGMKWKRVDSKDMKLPSRRVWSMAFDPHNSGLIFAGSHSSGVYRIERRSATADKDTDAEKTAGN
jgi:photosystem II stability/assembly factor-like uncharacterized protein